MISPLLWKEHSESLYNRYSYAIQPVIYFLFTLCAFLSLNANIGCMGGLRSPLVVILVCLVDALSPYGVIVFLTGCLPMAHVYAAPLEMALIILALILTVATLYCGFKSGSSYLIVLISLAFPFKIPCAALLLVGLGGSPTSVVPAGYGIFLYYLIMYVRQDADVLTNDVAVDIVQRYNQASKSVTFNQTMVVMTATYVVGIIIVYPIRRLLMDYSRIVAIVVSSAAEFLVVSVGDFAFGVTVVVRQLILNILLPAVIAAVRNFSISTVDYIRTEHVQLEDDDYYHYVKTVSKTNASTPDVKMQKIGTRKRSTRERSAY